MLDLVSLRKTGTGWEFASEAALEDFVWLNLPQLFGLTPLKRQYSVDGQFCDILALGESQDLVVLELKNVEDRYVVQQLTRYYHALCEEKAFSEQIDYEKPVRLIAIAPTFHRDNLIDRKYHHLSIEFWQFAVLAELETFYVQLKQEETEKVIKLQIPFQEKETNDDIPAPPRAFLKLLVNCTESEKQEILKIRRKILSFDRRMEEISSLGSVKYGNQKGKTTKLCAELCLDSKGNIILFLWLALKGGKSERVARARLWTDWNGKALIEGFVPDGIGAKITSSKKVIANRIEKIKEMATRNYIINSDFRNIRQYCKDKNLILKRLSNSGIITYEELNYITLPFNYHAVMFTNYTQYKIDKESYESLDLLIDYTLKKWLSRI
jgi:RecB family endonuclease NucS